LAVCAFIAIAVIASASTILPIGLIGATAIVIVVVATLRSILEVVKKLPELGQIPEWRNMSPAAIRAISEHLQVSFDEINWTAGESGQT
jgi:hypothetical protein